MAINFIPNMLVGSSAGETLSVTATKFVLIGMGGNDTLIGGAGRDLLFGDYFSTMFLNALMNDQTVTL